MATSSDSDEDETFVSLGTPLEVPDKDEPSRKPVKVQDMQAKDSRGRARFHGAFTGGFSAGYFNSVGSREGWAPSTFVSSRSNRTESIPRQTAEDFMDDEDVGEHGIAPRKLVTAGTFTSEERKRRRQHELLTSTTGSILPGESTLMDLIVPERITIGMKLLRKMGWKEGQGVGPRQSRKQRRQQNSSRRMIGCALPPSPSSDEDGLDDDTFLKDITYAPQDTTHILLASKDNTHGFGYRGINPHLALSSASSSGHVNLFEPPVITKTGRKGIRGQGFGVGALEEDDEDVYGTDDMSKYDMTMGGEEEDTNFGWTAPRGKGRAAETPVGYVGRVLEGFKLSTEKLVQKKDFPPPQLPRGYRPVHTFSVAEQPSTTSLTMGASAGVDYRQFLPPGSLSHDSNMDDTQVTIATGSQAKKKKQLKDAASRSLALGENAFVGSVFDLISAGDKVKIQAAKAGPSENEPGTSQGNLLSTHPPHTPASPSSLQNVASHKPVVPSLIQNVAQTELVATPKSSSESDGRSATEKSSSKLSNEELREKNVPLYQASGNTFRPFVKNPEKQERYEKYLELVKHGHKDAYSHVASVGQTEWEMEKEREEFAGAARLYKPLSGMMAMRFTTGSHNLDEANTADVDSSVDKSDAAKAAEMKMYGRLTRDVVEWHPNKLICKRFNVPDPYPGSSIIGLATVKRDKYSVFNFLDFATPTSSEVSNRDVTQSSSQSAENQTGSKENDVKQAEKSANQPKSMKSIFSHLMEPDNKGVQKSKGVSFTVKSNNPSQSKGFKSIFSHLEDEPVRGKLKPTEDENEKAAGNEADNNASTSDEINDSIKCSPRLEESMEVQKEEVEEKVNPTPDDLFRAIFKNTDSEVSTSSSEEEMEDNKDPVVKQETKAAPISPDAKQHHLPTTSMSADKAGPSAAEGIIYLPNSEVKVETLSDRLSVTSNSSDEESFGPALPPPRISADDSRPDTDVQYVKTVVDLTSSRPHPQFVDLTKESSKSHKKHKHKERHKDRHKSKKEKKEKHKKSKHKKKGKKKGKKKERKYESDSSDTSDKDSDESDVELPSDREILNRLKSLNSAQRMKANYV